MMTRRSISELNRLIFATLDRDEADVEKVVAALRAAGISHLLGVGGVPDREESVETLRDERVGLELRCDGYWGWRLEDGSVIEVDEELQR